MIHFFRIKKIHDGFVVSVAAYTGYRQEADGEPRYHPLPSRERLKSNYTGTSIYANDTILDMPNTHIYVNLMDTIDGDYCTIDDDYVDLN